MKTIGSLWSKSAGDDLAAGSSSRGRHDESAHSEREHVACKSCGTFSLAARGETFTCDRCGSPNRA